MILGGLRRWPESYTRRYALIAHWLTPPGIILTFSILGFGSLYATMALGAEYWAFVLATGVRPERLLYDGSMPRLAAFLAIAAAGTYMVRALIF
ncbi:hypothetical protein [Actinomadura barringtoniae]|uniref:hypothetical protein n=1 Tax=Actinomadura barringtoniae TaxID=1427535 RepID=UPI0027DE2297|nr:hypothetical protein [Actinomadura barringtoniae]